MIIVPGRYHNREIGFARRHSDLEFSRRKLVAAVASKNEIAQRGVTGCAIFFQRTRELAMPAAMAAATMESTAAASTAMESTTTAAAEAAGGKAAAMRRSPKSATAASE